MAENPADKDDFTSDSDSDWGADWEAAFQAEEDAMFSFDEGEYEELFKQAPNLPSSETAANVTVQPSSTAAVIDDSRLSLIRRRITALPQNIISLISAPKRLIKVGAYSIPLFIILFFLYTLFRPATSLPPAQPIPDQQLPAVDVSGPFEILEKTALLPDTPAPPHAKEAEPKPQLAPGEKIKKKWTLASFMIPAPAEDDESKLSFVLIDLTLVTLMHPDENLPEDKKNFVRDIIYQFYSNKPLYELRRYSLARGEMNRKLRAWLHKEWPDLEVESIIFDHYQVT